MGQQIDSGLTPDRVVAWGEHAGEILDTLAATDVTDADIITRHTVSRLAAQVERLSNYSSNLIDVIRELESDVNYQAEQIAYLDDELAAAEDTIAEIESALGLR